MDAFHWFLENFGIFFGSVFLVYLFMMVHRMTQLWDVLGRGGSPKGEDHPWTVPDFLSTPMARVETMARTHPAHVGLAADAVWAELDRRVSVHFQAVSGYVSTLVLIGFAGTIFGSIGAFNEMFQGLAQGQAAAQVFAAAWNKGLSTALYTSLGAAALGGVVLTLLGSRFLLTRAKALEARVSREICRRVEGGQ